MRRAIRRSGIPSSYHLAFANQLFELGRWLREQGVAPEFKTHYEFYEYLNNGVLRDCPIDFFEFGVWKGNSLRQWTLINIHPESRFYGFDSFEGIPEDWKHPIGKHPKGSWTAGGALPDIKDHRVRFIKGYFQDTLSGFISDNKLSSRRRVIHCDADLYSSTLYVLVTMHPLILPGTIIIFDEFNSVMDEFRAFSDYVLAFRRQFRLLASAEPYFTRVAIEMT